MSAEEIPRPEDDFDDVNGESLDNYLDNRLYYMRTLGGYMESAGNTDTVGEEHRVLTKWANLIEPFITTKKNRGIREKLDKAEKHLRRGKERAASKALNQAHRSLIKARPELYFPAQPTKTEGFTTVPWTSFLNDELTSPDGFESEFVDDRRTDFLAEKWMLKLRRKIREENDDYLLLTVGETNTGKSTLGLHFLDYYAKQSVDMDYVALDKQRHAQAVKHATEKELPRYVDYDEAPVYGRDAMSKYNKDLIKLYDSIRGKQIFNIWNNPRLDMLDKPFLDGPLDAVVYIGDKSTTRPRRYHVYTASQITQWYESEGKLTLDVLSSHEDDAVWTGWFRPRNDELWSRYEGLKDESMDSHVESFFEEWGSEDLMSAREASDNIDTHHSTFTKYLNKLTEDGVLEEDVDYKQTPSGAYKVPRKTMKDVEEAIENANK